MVCVLPDGATLILSIIVLVPAVSVGLATFVLFERIGRRRHPLNFPRRHNWSLAGVAVAMFLTFPGTLVLVSETVRPVMCEAYGSLEPRPGTYRGLP